MNAAPELSVVVLSWNTKALTLACLRALQADEPSGQREIVVVDNGSSDGSSDAVAQAFPSVRLLRNAGNAGYAEGNNQGARAARGEWLCLLNSDTQVRPGALARIVDFLRAHPDYGAAAPRLANPDGSVQSACKRFPGLVTALCYDTLFGKFWPGSRVEARYAMREFDHLHSRDVDQPPGACFVIRRDEYLQMGGLDPTLFLFFNDVDFCRRLRQRGRRIRYVAEAEVLHHGGASTRGYQQFVVVWHRNRLAYYRKHYGWFGALWLRAIVRWRALEEWVRLGRRHADPAARQHARADLRRARQEILAR